MKLKSYKTIQVLYIVVSATALLTACFPRSTAEPMKLVSGSNIGTNQPVPTTDVATVSANYGVTPASEVVFNNDSEKPLIDFAY